MIFRRKPTPEAPLLSGVGGSQPAAQPDVDQAWKLLSLVNDWVRFAEAKAGATLAFSGAMGTILFNLVSHLDNTGWMLNVSVVITCGLLFIAVVLAAWTIAPRVKDPDAVPGSINHLFFASIASKYDGKRIAYRGEVRKLTVDPESLVIELADQVHANAKIATSKTRRVTAAIRFSLIAGVFLAVVTTLVALQE